MAGVEAFRALPGQIDELRFWECAWNITDRPIAYDFAINSAVEDADALKRYLEHPAHQAAAAAVARVRHLGDRRLRVLSRTAAQAHEAPHRNGAGLFCVLWVQLFPQHGVMGCLHTVHMSCDAMTAFDG